jgi:hypothetical protein
MHITIDTASQFRNEFYRAGRGGQFSYEGLGLLFDYLEEVDPQYDLDVIALCCDYTQNTPDVIARDYSIDLNDDDTEEQRAAVVIEYVREQSALVGVTSTGSIVYASF